ncbi:heat shock protein 70 family [Syncephalis plumigaleata]|nr:heat shock protein 70 family [Syncephalis plumigaleata]
MSVVGIDFGNLQSVIAVARNRGIDVICNEVSNRATPSLVSFGAKQRFLGESAKTNEISNFRNTVAALKRLIGRRFNDPEVQQVEKQFITAELCEINEQVGVKVNYLEEETTFSSVQLVAMYFARLRETAVAELKAPVSDVVISVPGWFTDSQRRAILDAANIAGLNCLRLMNDTTAAALGYGITKTDLPEDKPRTVVFTDMGHSSFSVAVVEFKKGQLAVKGTAFDIHLGGRYFDEVLCDHLSEQFKEKYKIDVKSNKKALLRLRTACEKLKKVLSANSKAPLNVENIMEDRDVNAMVERSEFEALASDLLSRVEPTIQQALANAGITADQVDAIELVGGSMRIPAVKQQLEAIFGKELSTTLNQDEAIARGCALQCAMLSPAFRVREFAVQDITPYPIKFTWPSSSDPNTQSELDVFVKGNTIPSTKILTFYRKESFDVEALYAQPDDIPGSVNPLIGRFGIQNVVPTKDNDLSTVRVKARINIHGVVVVEGAHMVEEIVKEEEEAASPDAATPMETDDKSGEAGVDAASPTPASPTSPTPAPAAKKAKKTVKKHEIPVVSTTPSLPVTYINDLQEKEGHMHAADRLIIDTAERKNALEEYVYEMRDKLEMRYSEYAPEQDRTAFMALLNATEEWLYDEGDDTTKSVYIKKLDELRKHGDPIAYRYREAEERPRAVRALREAIDQYTLNASGQDARFEHISAEDKQKVIDRCLKVQGWLSEKLQQQDTLGKDQDPVIHTKDIMQERESLVLFATPILSKPKPKPAAPEPAPAPATPSSTEAAAAEEQSPAADTADDASKAANADMEVD